MAKRKKGKAKKKVSKMYFCNKCKQKHQKSSKIGKSHRKFSNV